MFAKRVFFISGVLGLIEIVPLFFLERHLAVTSPPAINHPEWFYGFLGVAFPWQLVFLLISRDPVRYRPLMPLAVIEKLGFVIPMAILYAMGRVTVDQFPGPAIDAVWVVFFSLAYLKTPRTSSAV